jgi:crossover junction endodeoxyribonuclease RuvC
MAYVDTGAPTEIVGKCVNFQKYSGWERLQLIAAEVERIVSVWNPDVIWVEGYAIYRVSSVVTVVSCGTVVRQVLYQQGRRWNEVPPTSLKKWCTGKGNAKKDDMAKAVHTRWGYKSPSDDIIDAVALAQLGVSYATQAPPPEVKGVSDGWK